MGNTDILIDGKGKKLVRVQISDWYNGFINASILNLSQSFFVQEIIKWRDNKQQTSWFYLQIDSKNLYKFEKYQLEKLYVYTIENTCSKQSTAALVKISTSY